MAPLSALEVLRLLPVFRLFCVECFPVHLPACGHSSGGGDTVHPMVNRWSGEQVVGTTCGHRWSQRCLRRHRGVWEDQATPLWPLVVIPFPHCFPVLGLCVIITVTV